MQRRHRHPYDPRRALSPWGLGMAVFFTVMAVLAVVVTNAQIGEIF